MFRLLLLLLILFRLYGRLLLWRSLSGRFHFFLHLAHLDTLFHIICTQALITAVLYFSLF